MPSANFILVLGVPRVDVRRGRLADRLFLGLSGQPVGDVLDQQFRVTDREPAVDDLPGGDDLVFFAFEGEDGPGVPIDSSPAATCARTDSGNLSRRKVLATVERSFPTAVAGSSCVRLTSSMSRL